MNFLIGTGSHAHQLKFSAPSFLISGYASVYVRSLVPLAGTVSHEEKVKYRTGGKEEEEEEKISERKAW